MRAIFKLIFIFIFVACEEKTESVSIVENDDHVVSESLIISEYSPKSNLLNEYGEEADWIELYNQSEEIVRIEEKTWSLTDNYNEPDKFYLPELIIQPKGFVVIWCDGLEVKDKDIHANFKLSGKGEYIGLYKSLQLVDEVTFGSDVKKDVSYGREDEGLTDWKKFKIPTPGSANSSSNNYAETLK